MENLSYFAIQITTPGRICSLQEWVAISSLSEQEHIGEKGKMEGLVTEIPFISWSFIYLFNW